MSTEQDPTSDMNTTTGADTMTTYTAAQAVEMLTSAGHDEADVLAAIDGLIDAGIEGPYDEATETQRFTAGDMSVLADQLKAV